MNAQVTLTEQVILTVGNGMMGDDAAGPLLSTLLQQSPAPGWQVVHGGSAPENVLHHVRAIEPQRVLVVDATEMELAPGEVRLIDDRTIVEQFIITTHDMPLSFLMAALRESVPEVHLLGIQPSLVAFGYPMSPAVHAAVTDIHARLRNGASVDAWPYLEASSAASHQKVQEET
jgi:hydrogenase 3 maturation protease